MFFRSKQTAPHRTRGKLTSHILIQKDDGFGSNLAVTWVDVEPGGQQSPHRHESEQMYVIVKGKGMLRVDQEERAVQEGDVVFIPPNAEHGIVQRGDSVLSYVSASTPTYSLTAAYDIGNLANEA